MLYLPFFIIAQVKRRPSKPKSMVLESSIKSLNLFGQIEIGRIPIFFTLVENFIQITHTKQCEFEAVVRVIRLDQKIIF